jgi:hypothetical protein
MGSKVHSSAVLAFARSPGVLSVSGQGSATGTPVRRPRHRQAVTTTRHGTMAITVRWLRKSSASQRIIIQGAPLDATSFTAAERAVNARA